MSKSRGYGDDQRLRTFSCRNKESHKVPPYGIMQIDDTDPYFGMEAFNGNEPVLLVKRPDEQALNQDPSKYVFNLRTEIGGYSSSGGSDYGRCTVDFPCQALHDDRSQAGSGGLPNGAACGPTPDRWTLFAQREDDQTGSSKAAFRCISHDPTDQGFKYGQMHRIWVSLNTKLPASWLSRIPGSTSANYQELFPLPDDNAKGVFPGLEYDASQRLFNCITGGTYQFGFQGTMTSSTADAGVMLAMSLVKRTPPSFTWLNTGWEAKRKQFKDYVRDYDSSTVSGGGISAGTDIVKSIASENVACSGIIQLQPKDQIALQNTGSTAAELIAMSIWFYRIAPYVAPITSYEQQ